MHIQHIVEDNEIRADRYIKNIYSNIEYGLLQKIFRKKLIKVDNKKISPSYKLQSGDVLKIYYPLKSEMKIVKKIDPKQKENLAQQFEKMIILNKEDIIAINKPSGLTTQLGSNIKVCLETFMNAYSDKLKLVHRLDKDTSGLMIIAKNTNSARLLTQLFREKKIHKTYYAIVDRKINEAGIINAPITHNGISLEAVSKYEPLKVINEKYTLLKLNPITGRKHQLRIHCAYQLHAPILGDIKYNKNNNHKKMRLHSQEINIPELGIRISCDLPIYFQNSL